jgi:cardiolipin synthase
MLTTAIRRVQSSGVKRSEIHENIYTIPNILALSRLISGPIIAYFILNGHTYSATSLLIYACLTDLFDGYIARKYKMQTVLGSILDPMADKTLMISMTVSLAYEGLLPAWLVVIIIGRDVLLGISALYYRYISLPAPRNFKRFWDFSLPSAEVYPTRISKLNTAAQFVLITTLTIHPTIN